VGLDGQWIGATNGNSYFYFSVDPGEHHLCTNWQGFSFLGKTRAAGALHFTAEPGGVYYFRAKDIYVSDKYFDLKLKQKWTAMKGNCWSADLRLAHLIRRSSLKR